MMHKSKIPLPRCNLDPVTWVIMQAPCPRWLRPQTCRPFRRPHQTDGSSSTTAITALHSGGTRICSFFLVRRKAKVKACPRAVIGRSP